MTTNIIKDLDLKFNSIYKKELQAIEEDSDGQSRGGKKSAYNKSIHQKYRIIFLEYVVKEFNIVPTLDLLKNLEKAITGKVSNGQTYIKHFDIVSTRTAKIKKQELKKISHEKFKVIFNDWMKIDTHFWKLFSKNNLKKLEQLRGEQQAFLNTLTVKPVATPAKPFAYTDINDEFNLL